MELSVVFQGTIVHATTTEFSSSSNPLQILQNGLIGISKEGTIAFIGEATQLEEFEKKFGSFKDKIQQLGKKFIIPGFVDTHLHAPQYAIAGTGTDLPLLDWLNKYTFPTETRYKDLGFAQEIFSKVVSRTLHHGTTTGCYYSTIHLEASKLLVDILVQQGQRALVGKVNMDRNSPDFYVETTENSIKQTEEFIQHIISSKEKSKLVTPCITPRFVPSCTVDLMKALGAMATKYNLPIQSHISENKNEVFWVKDLHPEVKNYAEVYDIYGLLNEKTIMAHGIYLTDEELELFKKRGVGISHCPVSNFTLHSGILDVRRALKAGVKVGLGTDISGGYSPSMLEVIRQSIVASNTLQFYEDTYKPLDYKEVFALATLGGAQVLALDKQIGNFEAGKFFDALIVDPFGKENTFDVTQYDEFLDIFQKFLLLGDDRSFESIYVHGVKVV